MTGISVRTKDVSVVRGRTTVLDRVNVEMAPGRLTAVTGPSGSGKTTLLTVLAGIERVDRGRVLVDGSRLPSSRPAALARRIGMVHQAFGLLSLLTAAENVELALQAAGLSRTEVMRRSRARLHEVGMNARAEHLIEELSGGEQQRVALARALAPGPDLLLADEPTAQLDADNRELVVALLRRTADCGVTVVVATHDEEVAALADHRIQLVSGRTV